MTPSEVLQIVIGIGFGVFVFWLLGQWIKYTTASYISLENRNKSLIRNLWEGAVDFIKVFKFW